jgi:integral membrane protein
MTTSLRRFLRIAFWEGISYLVLLVVCMPLKYGAGIAWPVRVVGSLHGLLFVAYGLALAGSLGVVGLRWAFIAMAASFVPGGTFWLDGQMRRRFGGEAAGAPLP